MKAAERVARRLVHSAEELGLSMEAALATPVAFARYDTKRKAKSVSTNSRSCRKERAYRASQLIGIQRARRLSRST